MSHIVIMNVAAIASFFKYKAVASIFVLGCWSQTDQVKFIRKLNQFDIRATVPCGGNALDKVTSSVIQGIIYMNEDKDTVLLNKLESRHFSTTYRWLVIGEELPPIADKLRYDSEIVMIKTSDTNLAGKLNETVTIYNINTHPGASSLHVWAAWNMKTGLQIMYEKQRIDRRYQMKNYPITIATPIGLYETLKYNGSFSEFLHDNSKPEIDKVTRSAFGAAELLTERIRAKRVIVPTQYWAVVHNSSAYTAAAEGRVDLSCGLLRPLITRIGSFDFVMPYYLFRVGFIYIAERETSGNMFVEPFSPGVWWCCLATGILLAIAQRIFAKAREEKEGAFISVLGTFLQQDASVIPDGASARFVFLVMSLWAMLVYSYYSSAIVSSLMSSGTNGPDSLVALGDSKYSIVSEDYDFMRYTMFDRKSNLTGMEYLKKKKLQTYDNFYQTVEQGAEMMRSGPVAFHCEYGNVYSHMEHFTDDQICKLSYIDTISAAISYLVAPKNSQYTDVFKSSSNWLHETGLAKRQLSLWQVKPPDCMAAMLAEKVRFGDVAPMIGVVCLGFFVACLLLVVEILVAKRNQRDVESDILSLNSE